LVGERGATVLGDRRGQNAICRFDGGYLRNDQ
jgi:hypothetical protein